MIDIHIQSDGDPHVLAELIASTLHGHIVPDPSSNLAAVGKLVREHQERQELKRPSRQQIDTVNFAKIDEETDFSDI